MTRVAGVAEQLDGGVDLTIDSNADEVSGELEQVDAALDELTGTSANIDIDADTEETLAESKFPVLRNPLRRLSTSMRPRRIWPTISRIVYRDLSATLLGSSAKSAL